MDAVDDPQLLADVLHVALNCLKQPLGLCLALQSEKLGKLLDAHNCEELLVTAVCRGHVLAVHCLCTLPALRTQGLSPVVAQDVLSIAACTGQTSIVNALCRHLPCIAELLQHVTLGLLLAVMRTQDTLAFGSLLTVPGRKYELGAADVHMLLKEAIFAGDMSNGVMHLCRLPASEGLAANVVADLLSLAVGAYAGRFAVACLLTLPAVRDIGPIRTAYIVTEAIESGQMGVAHALINGFEAGGWGAPFLQQLLLSLLQCHHLYQDDLTWIVVLDQLCILASATALDANFLFGCLRMSLSQATSWSVSAVHCLCSVAAAQQLEALNVYTLLREAILNGAVAAVGALCGLAGAQSMTFDAVLCLIKLCIRHGHASGVHGAMLALVSLPGVISGLRLEHVTLLLQAAEYARNADSMLALCTLIIRPYFTDCYSLTILLGAALSMRSSHLVELLSALPSTSGAQIDAHVVANLMLKCIECMHDDGRALGCLCQLAEAQLLTGKQIAGLLRVAVSVKCNNSVCALCELPGVQHINADDKAQVLGMFSKLQQSTDDLYSTAAKALYDCCC